LAHSWLLSACDLTTFLGFLLAVPLPRPRRASIVRLAAVTFRRLTVPAALGAAAVIAVNNGMGVASGCRYAVIAGWWLALLLGTWQAVRTIAGAEVADVAVPSSGCSASPETCSPTRRLRRRRCSAPSATR